jgi:hypothetical protein
VPIQVMLQSRPAREEKGRMIATMNQFTWIGVILSAVLYFGCIRAIKYFGGPQNLVFAVAAAIMLPIAIFYRPQEQTLVDD